MDLALTLIALSRHLETGNVHGDVHLVFEHGIAYAVRQQQPPDRSVITNGYYYVVLLSVRRSAVPYALYFEECFSVEKDLHDISTRFGQLKLVRGIAVEWFF